MRKTGGSTDIVFPPEAAAREGKAPYIFQQSDRSWIRQKGSFGVELMFWDTDSPNANTSVLDVSMKNNHSEVNEKLAEVPRENPRGQILEGKPLSKPSRMSAMSIGPPIVCQA